MVDLRASGDQSEGMVWRVILGPFWVNSEVNIDPYLGNLIIRVYIAFIWPWVGLALDILLNMGPGRCPGSTPV